MYYSNDYQTRKFNNTEKWGLSHTTFQVLQYVLVNFPDTDQLVDLHRVFKSFQKVVQNQMGPKKLFESYKLLGCVHLHGIKLLRMHGKMVGILKRLGVKDIRWRCRWDMGLLTSLGFNLLLVLIFHLPLIKFPVKGILFDTLNGSSPSFQF